jgi:hypothetical protein
MDGEIQNQSPVLTDRRHPDRRRHQRHPDPLLDRRPRHHLRLHQRGIEGADKRYLLFAQALFREFHVVRQRSSVGLDVSVMVTETFLCCMSCDAAMGFPVSCVRTLVAPRRNVRGTLPVTFVSRKRVAHAL